MEHIFAGNPLDRGDVIRRDENLLSINSKSENAKYLLMKDLNPLVLFRKNNSLISWKKFDYISKIFPKNILGNFIFLGSINGEEFFVLDVSMEEKLILEKDESFCDSREIATELSQGESGILSQARAQLEWHKRTKFCSSCGAETTSHRGGQVRRCLICKMEHFPRTDPVAIMLVYKGEKCILGQTRARQRSGFYSCLAGFIDQGESIEEAVKREVKEESGLMVGNIVYHSSQPWPFPSSLMIGCHAQALTEEINYDEEEMSDVRWFTKKEVNLAINSESSLIKVPGPVAIAHHLIKSWVNGESPKKINL